MDKNIVLCILTLIGVILLTIFAPVIGFVAGYFSGWILELCVGDMITEGLNLIFDTTRFEADKIPMFCATMGLIGGFFKSKLTVSKNKQN